MNPAWVSVLIGLAGSFVGAAFMAAVGFAALKAWMARREEREKEVRKDVDDHEERMRYLERMEAAR